MAHKETYTFPVSSLEISFAGDETKPGDLNFLRARFKDGLIKCLIKDGAVFEDEEAASRWKGNNGADSRLEAAIDSWVGLSGFQCAKAKDKVHKKVRWILSAEEEITLLLLAE